jgi:hypothetical protein
MLISPWVSFGRWYFRHGLWRCGWPGFTRAATWGIYAFLTEAKRLEMKGADPGAEGAETPLLKEPPHTGY